MALNLVASYFVGSAAQNSTALVSPSFTPATGEIIVVKGCTESQMAYSGNPTATGGGISDWNRRVYDATSNHCWSAIWTGTITSGGSSITVSSSALSSPGWHSMVVERWADAKLATTPATGDTRGSDAPTATITTAANNSKVSWLNADWAAVDGTSNRSYRSSAVEDTGGFDYHNGAYTAYYATQDAATAGSQTYGLTAPGGQTYTLLSIEIQASVSTVDADISATAVTGTTSIPTPIVSVPAYPTAVTGSTSIPTPAVKIHVLVSTTAVAGTTTIPTPTIKIHVSISATAVSASTAIASPTVWIAPVTINASTAIATPVVRGHVSITPTVINASTEIATPVVRGHVSITATAVAGTTAIYAVTITSAVSITGAAVAATTSMPSHTVTAGGGQPVSGPYYGSVATDRGGAYDGSWVNPTNAQGSNDDQYATWEVPA